MSLCLITNIQEVKTDVLAQNRRQPLRIVTLEGQLVEQIPPPLRGWTHATLFRCSQRDDLASEIKHKGAEAYLGTTWIGSTET